jgi:hypothetical protein
MKIIISINNFKKEENLNPREKMCIDSLHKLKKLYPHIKLVNLTFEDEQFATLTGFENIHCLKQIPKNITQKKIPFVNEIFDNLASTDADYFIFINNDILVSNRFIKAILENPNYDCFPASKLHFTKLDSIDDLECLPDSLSVHGFDGFGIKCNWWKQNKQHFKPILLSRAYWDTYFYCKCQLYGNSLTLNKPPAVLFHLDHSSTSMEQDSGNSYNEQIFIQDPDNLVQRWFSYVQNILLKRSSYNNIKWYVPFDNEIEIEKKYFTL